LRWSYRNSGAAALRQVTGSIKQTCDVIRDVGAVSWDRIGGSRDRKGGRELLGCGGVINAHVVYQHARRFDHAVDRVGHVRAIVARSRFRCLICCCDRFIGC